MSTKEEALGRRLPRWSDFQRLFEVPKEERHRRWRLFKTYIPDWIIVILINMAGGLFQLLKPRHREFSLNDQSIQYSSHHSFVPNFVPPLVAYASPILSALLFLVFRRRNWHDLHCTVLGIFLAMGLNNTATNVIKNASGRLRPDFLDRCQPNITENPTLKLVDYRVCTQTDLGFLHEGMRSFPSGHASLAFCGLTYTSLYLASHLRYNDQRGHAYKTIVFFLPLFFAALIAISRTADYNHHWEDVLAGSNIGGLIGWFGYRTYFPSAFDPTIPTDRPFPGRIPKIDDTAPFDKSCGRDLPVDDDLLQIETGSRHSLRKLDFISTCPACQRSLGVPQPASNIHSSHTPQTITRVPIA